METVKTRTRPRSGVMVPPFEGPQYVCGESFFLLDFEILIAYNFRNNANFEKNIFFLFLHCWGQPHRKFQTCQKIVEGPWCFYCSETCNEVYLRQCRNTKKLIFTEIFIRLWANYNDKTKQEKVLLDIVRPSNDGIVALLLRGGAHQLCAVLVSTFFKLFLLLFSS